MDYVSHHCSSINRRSKKSNSTRPPSTSSSSCSLSSELSISTYSDLSDADFNYICGQSKRYNHVKILSSEEADRIKRDLVYFSWTSHMLLDAQFVDNKLLDFDSQNEINPFLSSKIETALNTLSNPKPTKAFKKSIANTDSLGNTSINFRHFNDWRSHLIYFKLIKGYAHNQHLLRKCCKAHAAVNSMSGIIESVICEHHTNASENIFFTEKASVYENHSAIGKEGEVFFFKNHWISRDFFAFDCQSGIVLATSGMKRLSIKRTTALFCDTIFVTPKARSVKLGFYFRNDLSTLFVLDTSN